MGLTDLSALSNMLSEGEKMEEQKIEQDRVAKMGPGDIGPKKALPPPEKPKDPKAIWDEDEVDTSKLLNKVKKTDKRERPKYDLRYRQQINTDDALGAPWSVQDNSSMSCKDIVIRVTMPDTKFSTVKLDVNTNEFLVQSPKFLLALPLSENVDSDKGSAKWDSDTCVLEVILPIVRGADFAHYSQLDDPEFNKQVKTALENQR
mmetsp:Transcript_46874/g.68835  ORF Transcript_46874/g.68835 Transcript_46874/m.68835 type:complete len:204 (-) Transcript_46874:4-615(-)|eukprot:CAMPEP_0173091100 /NCGR_PEP_ID=MMETSP1102-20130122/27600_1 /TAXON_ID=49646 /ORGANISM="Geminigera sp., Strain Caron Lab Isolate" /LENGTH=203 /DNA_ID=CAMNT_0013976673 /DNA_START=1 /DNA_END=612 /DNA_ORIENTATION=+